MISYVIQDIPSTFAMHKAHCKEQNNSNRVDVCEKCKIFRDNEENVKAARTHYQEDQNVDAYNTSIFTADVQKVILFPKLTLKERYFVSRLVVFYETFASVKKMSTMLFCGTKLFR